LLSYLLYKKPKIIISNIIILPVVLYGSETLALALIEEHRQNLLQNSLITRMFRPKWDEIIINRRKLHNEESCN
jgi:hypothetical protein